jgi:hypothetical protein
MSPLELSSLCGDRADTDSSRKLARSDFLAADRREAHSDDDGLLG